MKLAIIFLIVFISGVLGLDEASETGLSIAADEETMNEIDIEDTTPFWVDMNSLSNSDHGTNDRNLGSCRTCRKKYLYFSACEPEYQNPEMHRNYKTPSGCQYTCCTDIKNDPGCCRLNCDKQCAGSYVLNNGCRKGYKKNMEYWGSFEIGPDGPIGYRKTPTMEHFHYEPRCYHGCCADTTVMDDTSCCSKA